VARLALSGDGPGNLTKMPTIIAAAARGQLDPDLADIVATDPLYCSGYRPVCTGPGGKGFSHGVYLTVFCRDEAPFIDSAALTRETQGDRTLAAVFTRDPYLAACAAWSVPPADPVVHEAVQTSVPQLMMSGQFDSFSPPPVTKQSAKAFEHAWALEVPGQTHNVLGFSDCPISIRNAWITNPASPPAPTSCLNNLRIAFSVISRI
jgi:pimeloyl-ACP methyl ester carboxylesterase